VAKAVSTGYFGNTDYSAVSVSLSQVEFTLEEHAAIQAALKQRLGPEFISQRPGGGGQKVGFFISHMWLT